MSTTRQQLRRMKSIPGGAFWMGSADFYPEERPVHQVTVDGFWMDEHPVTVAEYRRFVAATGYVTMAERPLDPAAYPDADPALLVPGSLVFHRTKGPVDLRDYRNWWAYVPGASWRSARRAGQRLARPRAAPGDPGRLRGRRSLREPGPGRNCPPRRNGSTRPAVAWTGRSTPGAMSSRRVAG